MLSSRIPAMRNQALIGVSLFVLGLWLAWEVGGKIVADDTRFLVFAVLVFAACVVAATVLRNWRTGFYLFFVWMLFEDLVRKYMGNSLELFFGKDILVAFVYVALFVEIRRGREKTFRPPFLLFLSSVLLARSGASIQSKLAEHSVRLAWLQGLFLLRAPSLCGIRADTQRRRLAQVLGGQARSWPA